MGIIGNIQNNIVVIYEIESFYVTLASGKFFQIIYIEQITILPIVKNLKKLIPQYDHWVVLCTVKNLLFLHLLGISNPRITTRNGLNS
jgi:hypothetical protein